MKTVEVIVSTTGDIQIDAVGFKGTACEKATKFLEQALGVVRQKAKKPEYQQGLAGKHQQRIDQ